MNDDTQRLALAILMKWDPTKFFSWAADEVAARWDGQITKYWLDPGFSQYPKIPHYTQDLNAMREVKEAILIDYDTYSKYLKLLERIVPHWLMDDSSTIPATQLATAANEAEAILRLTNLWGPAK